MTRHFSLSATLLCVSTALAPTFAPTLALAQTDTPLVSRSKVMALVMTMCHNAILGGVRDAIEGIALGQIPTHVLKIYNVEVFAETTQGAVLLNMLAKLPPIPSNSGVHMPAAGIPPTCTALVMTNYGEQSWAYNWKVIDNQTFATVQPWD